MFKQALVLAVLTAAVVSACATTQLAGSNAFEVNGAQCHVVPPSGWYPAYADPTGKMCFVDAETGDMVLVQYLPQRYAHAEYALVRDAKATSKTVYVSPPGVGHGLVRLEGNRAAEIAQALKLVCSR